MSASGFESVIGLEVHVQLATRTKLFCGCRNEYGAPPNTNVCEVCTGQPGALPVLNEAALHLAVRAGLALGCEIAERTKFDRKNYFYPDLPKGYQISQYDLPVNTGGGIDVEGDDGATRRIRVVRAHLEEDAGKNVHPADGAVTLVDLNRAGIPLLEIVTAPDLRTPAEAHRFLTALKRTLRYARVSECDMEKGSLRCDANASVRKRGAKGLGTRTEIKNLNSFRNVERALEHEIARQVAVVERGGAVVQETRSWREEQEVTEPLRSKEEAEDYRYFPDPDLPELAIERELVDRIREQLPEMPEKKAARYAATLALDEKAAAALVAERDTAEYFERALAAAAGGDPRTIANFVLGAALQAANEQGVPLGELKLGPEALADVSQRVAAGSLSNQAAKKVLAEIVATGRTPAQVVKDLGLEQVSDREALEAVADQVLAAGAKAVADYLAGNENSLNALVGGVMKATKGRANPNLAREILLERLAQRRGSG